MNDLKDTKKIGAEDLTAASEDIVTIERFMGPKTSFGRPITYKVTELDRGHWYSRPSDAVHYVSGERFPEGAAAKVFGERAVYITLFPSSIYVLDGNFVKIGRIRRFATWPMYRIIRRRAAGPASGDDCK